MGILIETIVKSYFEVEAEVEHCLTVVDEGVHLAYKIKFNI